MTDMASRGEGLRLKLEAWGRSGTGLYDPVPPQLILQVSTHLT